MDKHPTSNVLQSVPEQHVNVQNNMLMSKTMRHTKHNMLEIGNTSQYYFTVYSTWYYKAYTQYIYIYIYIILHYKACKNYFPVLLCNTKLAQSILSSTTLYCKACPQSSPTLPNTSVQLANRISTPKRQNNAFEALFTDPFRSLHAATPIQFTRSSCTRQKYYACTHTTKQP